ncbi:MAG: dTDP-4-dehydrorhamnose reductase [Pseudomonadota bacterium]
MKLLLLGPNGQVGWELRRALSPLGEVIALGRDDGGDLTQPDVVAARIADLRPDWVVNAAAHTAVDRAESEPALAMLVNAEAPGRIAEAARSVGAGLVHYGTDYVFDGSGSRAWREDDATGPLGVYGRSKLAGEAAIAASGVRYLNFRTSWVYAARGGNFAKTMLRLARERDALNVVADQIGAPTGAELIADVTAHAIRREGDGTYHLAAAGETSWHDYARFVIDFARERGEAIRVAPDAVRGIPAADYPTPVARPYNSRLDTTKLRADFDLTLPDWRLGVERMLAETLTGV